tara:strand:+ start:2527 stop:3225 length:699 start_codon:yes stop_codon:yes gene_type:complete
MYKILIKAMRPHRQKVLTAQGEEKRLQQWANQLAAQQLRGDGQGASGEQFEQARDALMREAVMSPEKHGLKFMGERVPFEGQRLSEELSEADPEGEAAAIDSQFAPEENEEFFEANNTVRDNSDYHSKLFDEQGNLRSTLKPDEEEEAENTKTERQHVPMDADHPDYFKTSRQVAFRDAWSLLKQGPYDSEGRYLEHKDIALCPQAKAYLASGQRLDKDPNFCNSCDFCHGK